MSKTEERKCNDRARQMMKRLDESKKCTSATVKKIIDALTDKEELEEYVGVKLYYTEECRRMQATVEKRTEVCVVCDKVF